jgi:endonuclease-3
VRKQERAEIVQERLADLYPDVPIPLDHRDEFTLLVAVLLSAQCTDKKVNEITPALFEAADTPQVMWDLGESAILKIIRPLGLSKQKAKSIAKLSQIIVEKHDGQVPESFEQLEELPGVGHKTASVVMSQAFGHPAFPVDTHIHRLAQRWGLTNGKNVVRTEADLKKLFAESSWNRLHLQIIFYGRESCTARGCDGTKCGICRELYPNRKKPFVAKKA